MLYNLSFFIFLYSKIQYFHMKLILSFSCLQKNKSSSYAFLCEVADDMSMMPKVVETMKYFDDVDTILQQVAKVIKLLNIY